MYGRCQKPNTSVCPTPVNWLWQALLIPWSFLAGLPPVPVLSRQASAAFSATSAPACLTTPHTHARVCGAHLDGGRTHCQRHRKHKIRAYTHTCAPLCACAPAPPPTHTHYYPSRPACARYADCLQIPTYVSEINSFLGGVTSIAEAQKDCLGGGPIPSGRRH